MEIKPFINLEGEEEAPKEEETEEKEETETAAE